MVDSKVAYSVNIEIYKIRMYYSYEAMIKKRSEMALFENLAENLLTEVTGREDSHRNWVLYHDIAPYTVVALHHIKI